MELSDLRLALRRYWPIAVAALALWLGFGVVIGVLPEKRYRASATMLAVPSEAAADNVSQAANFEIPNLVARINSRSFSARVAGELPQGTSGATIYGAATPGTGIVRVVAEGGVPAAVAAWATEGAEQAVLANSGGLLDLELLDRAVVPGEPFAPKTASSMLASTIAGLISAVLATVAVHRARRALDLEAEIRRRLNLPVIGQLPAIRRLRFGSSVSDGSLAENPNFAEVVQGIRTSVELALLDVDRRDHTVAVASWSSGEGKSTVAAALGVAVAAGGRDVVVVDADLRQPTQHVKLGEPFGEGLSECGRVDVLRLLRRTRQPGLHLLLAGIPDRHPSDVIAANLPQALHRLTEARRLVIIDAPPVHGIAETPLILSLAQRIILVVDASSTKLPEIERAVEELRGSGVLILGVVVNRVRRHKGAAYGAYAAPVPATPRRPEPARIAPAAAASPGREAPQGQAPRTGPRPVPATDSGTNRADPPETAPIEPRRSHEA